MEGGEVQFFLLIGMKEGIYRLSSDVYISQTPFTLTGACWVCFSEGVINKEAPNFYIIFNSFSSFFVFCPCLIYYWRRETREGIVCLFTGWGITQAREAEKENEGEVHCH